MQCSVCMLKGQPGYVKHTPCSHYVCFPCVRSSLSLTGLHPANHLCGACEPEVDYQTECPSCYIVYTEQCPREAHDCLDDQGIYDL
jgi:hypothetical protein